MPSSEEAFVVPMESHDIPSVDDEDCITGLASVSYTLTFPGISEEKLYSYIDIMRRVTNKNVIYLVESGKVKVLLEVDDFCAFPSTRASNMDPDIAAVHDQTYRRCRSANEFVKLIYESIMRLVDLEKTLKGVLYVDEK